MAKASGGRRPFGEEKRLRRSITPDQGAWALATELAAEDKSSVSQLFDRLVEAEADRRNAKDRVAKMRITLADPGRAAHDRLFPPDRFCITEPDGSCSSKDPRCMHNS